MTVGGGSSADIITILNGNGNITVTGPLVGNDTVFALTGRGGSTEGADWLESSVGMAGAMKNAEELADRILLEAFRNGPGRDLTSIGSIRIDFDSDRIEEASADATMSFFQPGRDTMSPTDEFFFLGLRTDAASAKAKDESSGEGAGEASDEESDEELILEEGLPGRPGAVIIDLREKTEPVEPGWILSLN